MGQQKWAFRGGDIREFETGHHTDEYQQGVADGRRDIDPRLRVAAFEAGAEEDAASIRQQLDEDLVALTLKAEKHAEMLQEAKIALAARRPGTGLLGVLPLVGVTALGWVTETSMTIPVVEVFWAPHPVFLWLAAGFIAGLAPFATKLAIAEHAPLGKSGLRVATAALAVVVVTLLSWYRADALVLESAAEGGFVAGLVAGRFWLTFGFLVAVYGGTAFLTALGFETAVYAWDSSSLRCRHAHLDRAHSKLVSEIAELQSRARNIESATKTAVRASTTRYETGFAEGAYQRGSGGGANSNSGWLPRVLSTFGIRLLLVGTLTAMSTGCGYTSDGITSVVQGAFNTTPKNVTAVILDPYGASPMKMAVAYSLAQDIVGRTGRCSTLLFVTPHGFHNSEKDFRLVFPCSAARTRRDSDLDKVYAEFDQKFSLVLHAWWAVKEPHIGWDVDYVGTLRRVAEELRLAEGKRTFVALSAMWWVDQTPGGGPPALGPLPVLDFSNTNMYLGFTHGFSHIYEFWRHGKKIGEYSSYPVLIENWTKTFHSWKVSPDKLTVNAFGPENAHEWIARHLGDETSAYRKWRRAQPSAPLRPTAPRSGPRINLIPPKYRVSWSSN